MPSCLALYSRGDTADSMPDRPCCFSFLTGSCWLASSSQPGLLQAPSLTRPAQWQCWARHRPHLLPPGPLFFFFLALSCAAAQDGGKSAAGEVLPWWQQQRGSFPHHQHQWQGYWLACQVRSLNLSLYPDGVASSIASACAAYALDAYLSAKQCWKMWLGLHSSGEASLTTSTNGKGIGWLAR